MFLSGSVFEWKSTEKEAEKCCCVQEAQHFLEEQLPTATQEDQNSGFRGRFDDAPRKGGPVLAGKCPRSTRSRMEPKPTQATAKRNTTLLPYLHDFPFCANTRGSKSCKTCAAEGLRKQTMKHRCRRSSRKGPLGPRQGCGRVRGSSL